MNTRAILGLAVSSLFIGLLGGLAIGDGKSGPEKATEPGPTRTVAGVPVGYERSKEGAVEAALAFEGVLGRLPKMTKESRAAALKEMASDANETEIVDAANKALSYYDEQFGEAGIVRYSVVGYRVTAYESSSVDVELWEVNVVGRPETIPARSAWATRRLSLNWADDWKLAKPPTDSPGPTPALEGAATDAATIIASVQGLDEVRYVPLP